MSQRASAASCLTIASIMRNKAVKKVLIALFWVLLWEIVALLVKNSIVLPAPDKVLIELFNCVIDPEFWKSALLSALRIAAGFTIGALLGICAAAASKASPFVRELLSPIIGIAKTVPVASFIILVLIWGGSGNVALIVSAIMTFPILAVNTLAGLDAVQPKMLEVADVFGMSLPARIKGIYLPALYPHIAGAVELGVGMAVRSGIAAEVIGQPIVSLGNEMYRAKIFLNTERVLAVTVVTVTLGWLFGKAVKFMVRRAFGEKDD